MVEPDLFDKIQADGPGNPLFVLEKIKWMEQAHILRKRKGSWILDKSMVREEIPKAIEDIIWRRLIGLSRKHQDMIGILSVLGSSFEMDVARKLLEKEERWTLQL